MAGKQINEYPESTNPSGNWFVLVDDGTGCYKKVKLSNLPGGGGSTTSTTTTAAGGSTTSTSTTAPIVPTTSTTTTAAFDPAAIAFFEAAGITNPTQRSAVNTLVVTLKSDGLWTKMKAIYPFVGGSASSHKFNLINPLDTDAAFRLTFDGSGWTHDANGATANGTTSYANMYFNASATGTNPQSMGYSFAMGAYLTNTPSVSLGATNVVMGAFTSGANTSLQLDNNGNALIVSYVTGSTFASFVSSAYTRLSLTSRVNDSNFSIYRDGALGINDSTLVSGNHPNINLFLGATNDNGAANYFTDGSFAFAFISGGSPSNALSAGDVTNLTNSVNAFQTALGRAV
jgi:hypothetical protein